MRSPSMFLRHALPLAVPAVLGLTLLAEPQPLTAKPPRTARKTDTVEKPLPVTATVSTPVARRGTLEDALQIARASQTELAKIKDYTCTFGKKERVQNQLIDQTMAVKFRSEPMSVYMKFLKPAGREVLFCQKAYDGKLLVREGGFASLAGTFVFALDAPDVMRENRYPISSFGMANLVQLTIEGWEKESKHPEITVKLGEGKFDNVDCHVIEVTRPQPRPECTYHYSKLYFAKASKLPLRVEHYSFPVRGTTSPLLVEEYTYTNVKPNVGLADVDFDRRNRQYNLN